MTWPVIQQYLKKYSNEVFDLIFPIQCVGCDREGSWFCADCLNGQQWQTQQTCLVCKTTNSGQVCPQCKSYCSLDGVVAMAEYDGAVKRLIKICKYQFSASAGQMLGNLLILAWGEYLRKQAMRVDCPHLLQSWQTCLLVPIALSNRRLRWRGFNQTEVIAEQLGNYFEVVVENGLQRQHRQAQVKLSRRARQKNLQAAFTWQGSDVLGRRIILIDDVATTTATLQAASQALKAAGAKEVWGLVIARG
jgi:ComF family protein